MASPAVSDLPDFDGDIRIALIPVVDLSQTDVSLRNRKITGAALAALMGLTPPTPSGGLSFEGKELTFEGNKLSFGN